LRRSLGVRTVFNLLGPLVNPLRPDTQVLGVGAADLLDPMADALARLGLQRAVVVHGHGGLDEASLSGVSQLRLIEAGQVRSEGLDPEALGLTPAPMEALVGGDVTDNRAILEAVLQGDGSAAQRDVVALNAALVLWAAGCADSVAAALPLALEAMASGAAWQRFERLRTALA
jgi:anthranilate phosphoribosyltransferase